MSCMLLIRRVKTRTSWVLEWICARMTLPFLLIHVTRKSSCSQYEEDRNEKTIDLKSIGLEIPNFAKKWVKNHNFYFMKEEKETMNSGHLNYRMWILVLVKRKYERIEHASKKRHDGDACKLWIFGIFWIPILNRFLVNEKSQFFLFFRIKCEHAIK